MPKWIDVCDKKGVRLKQFTKVKPHWVPIVLNLPNWLFSRLAKSSLDIDPLARSSMWEDVRAGRKTEIEYLNGAVMSLANSLGLSATVNQAICDAIH